MEKQITTTLPRSAWENVKIQASDQPLVIPEETSKLKLLVKDKGYLPSFLVRTAIVEKLQRAAELLPEGLILMLIEGYRPVANQQLNWDNRREKFAIDNPDWDGARLDLETGMVTARPNTLANHNCGGAVDVVLATSDGTLVDMGSPYISDCNPSEWREKFPMLSPEITAEQASNRKILREVMEALQFVWYPGEWWHFCWGDRMWAVYTGRKVYYYGPVNPDKHIPAKK